MGAAPGNGVGIVGMGVYLPEQVRTNDFWPESWRQAHTRRAPKDLTAAVDVAVQKRRQDVDPEVAAASEQYAHDVFRGTQERRVLADDLAASDMEARACQRALDAVGWSAADVDLFLMFSQVPDYASPANHGLVAEKLGLRDTVACTVAAGCGSFVPQLVLAQAMIRAGEAERALICVGSATSRATDYDLPSSVNGGDGAVAACIARVDAGHGIVAHAQITRGDLHCGVRMVPTEREVRWTDSGGPFTIQNVDRTATHEMGAHAARLCKEVCDRVLDKAGVTVDEVDFFVSAQSTAWFGEALANALGIDASKRLGVEDHFVRYAHLLPASAPLNLSIAVASGRVKKGDLVLMYSPGAGFIQAATLLRWGTA